MENEGKQHLEKVMRAFCEGRLTTDEAIANMTDWFVANLPEAIELTYNYLGPDVT